MALINSFLPKQSKKTHQRLFVFYVFALLPRSLLYLFRSSKASKTIKFRKQAKFFRYSIEILMKFDENFAISKYLNCFPKITKF